MKTIEENVKSEVDLRGRYIGNGMAIAAGILMQSHGAEAEAAEILSAAGYRTVRDLRADGVDWYDIRLLVPVLRHFRDLDRSRSNRVGGRMDE